MAHLTALDAASRTMPMAKKWMQKAVKRPGALTKKAEAAGESPMAFAESHAHAPGLTGQQARFALIAQNKSVPKERGAAGGKKSRISYTHSRGGRG